MDALSCTPKSENTRLPDWQQRYREIARDTGLSGNALAMHLANLYGLPFEPNPSAQQACPALSQLPKNLLERYPTIALDTTNAEHLRLAVFYPYPEDFLREWRFFSNRHCDMVVVGQAQWESLWQSQQRYNSVQHFEQTQNQDEPVIAWLQALLSENIQKHCSDLHFEPQETAYRVRARRDGRLCTVQTVPEDLAQRVISRIKILANLDIAERRFPQDGGFNLDIHHKVVHFRVSTCPVINGEKLVIRILDTHLTALSLDQLGMPPTMLKDYKRILHKPQGMILVTGPTGSGKSVTLYASLCSLNRTESNIATIEDPVEMQIAGLNQVPINLKSGLDFPTVLRALLRQDPDIIMVGEIRDSITADIAVRAAQTGHLLMSTIHSNSAPETLIRLMNMGIPAYQICGALRCIIAQRLLRKLCPHCKQAVRLPPNLTGLSEALCAFDAKGCEHCHEGYQGRIGVFEYLEMRDALESLFLKSPTLPTLKDYMREYNIPRLRDAALQVLAQGNTSLAEIQRVIDMDCA